MPSRTDRSALADWLWTIDRYLLAGFLILMLGGLVFSFAASPSVAERIELDSSHFITRQLFFIVPSICIMLAISALSPHMIRRISLVLFFISIGLLIYTLIGGLEAKGAKRWVTLGSFSIQASEFVKPAFVVLVAYLLAQNKQYPDIPGKIISFVLLVIVSALLVAQPDFGQFLLLVIIWSSMIFMSGMLWFWIILLGALGLLGIVTAYMLLPHVADRVDRFLNPGSGDTFQIDSALKSFGAGGWFGLGPGEGKIKRFLPDGHSDFVFAVAAEEFGIVVCLVVVAVFAFVVIRGFTQAMRNKNSFQSLAIAGLIVMFGLQSCINLAVNLNMMPTKGMTLPFISYGGSSLLSMAIGMGFVLGLSRQKYFSKQSGISITNGHIQQRIPV